MMNKEEINFADDVLDSSKTVNTFTCSCGAVNYTYYEARECGYSLNEPEGFKCWSCGKIYVYFMKDDIEFEMEDVDSVEDLDIETGLKSLEDIF